MIGVAMKVTFDDGVVHLAETTARTVVDFEARFGVGIIELFTGAASMTGVWWLAWESMRAAGDTTLTFDEFIDRLDDFEVIDGAPDLPPPKA